MFKKGCKRPPLSEEWNRKLSAAHHKSRVVSDETKLKISQNKERAKKISVSLSGHIISASTRKKIGNSNRGKKRTEVQIQRMSLVAKGKIPWNKGKTYTRKKNSKPFSDEYRKKMSQIGLNRKFSKEHNEKISIALTGKKKSKEHVLHMSNHICSEETRKKMREKRRLLVIPFKDTSIEIKLQDELASREYGFYKHYPIIGQPDIAFPDKKLAIFADGDFFHANPEKYSETNIIKQGHTAKYIWEKDTHVNEELRSKGWRVLRYWEHEINDNVVGVVDEIEEVLMVRS